MIRTISSLLSLGVLMFGLASPVYADCPNPDLTPHANVVPGPQEIIGLIQRPCELFAIPSGAAGISKVLGLILEIIYSFAGVIFVFMLVFGAVQWMVSGGDKEALANARKRIINAIIGIFLLALTALIVGLIGKITNFQFYGP